MPLMHLKSSTLPDNEWMRIRSFYDAIDPAHNYTIREISNKKWFSRNTVRGWITEGRDIAVISGKKIAIYLQADYVGKWVIPGSNFILFLKLIEEYQKKGDTIDLKEYISKVEGYNSRK